MPLSAIVSRKVRRSDIPNQPPRKEVSQAGVKLVGKRIASLRQMKGFSIPDLAETAGVSKGYLWQLETGEEPNPSLSVVAKIATALGTTAAELLGQPSVKAKKLPIPEKLPRGLKEFLDQQKRKGESVPEDIVRALAQLQSRGLTEWEFVYEAIKRTTPPTKD